MEITQNRLLPLGEVLQRVGCSRSRVYAEIGAGRFPRPIKYGASSRWVESEISAWVADRIAERDAKAGA